MTFNNEMSSKVKQFGKDTNLFIRSRYHVIEFGVCFVSIVRWGAVSELSLYEYNCQSVSDV
jgi:hypothetical protein